MPVYAFTSVRTNTRFGPYIVPGASGQVIWVAMHFFPDGGLATATVLRAALQHYTGGTVTVLEPEHSLTRSRSQSGSSGAFESVTPTGVTGNPYVLFGAAPEQLWTPGHYQFPRPSARVVVDAGEQTDIQVNAAPGTGIATVYGVRYSEGGGYATVDRVARRPREHGWWHRNVHKRVKVPAGTTPPAAHQVVHDKVAWAVMTAARQSYLREHASPFALLNSGGAQTTRSPTDTGVSQTDVIGRQLAPSLYDDGLSWSKLNAQDAYGRGASSGAGWGTADAGGAWAQLEGAAATTALTGNAGTLAPASASRSSMVLGSAVDDQEVVCDMTLDALPSAGTEVVAIILRETDVNNYLLARLSINALGVASLGVQLVSAGSFNAVQGLVTVPTPTTGTAYRMRARIVGTTVSVKWWQASLSEPAAWTTQAAMAGANATGLVGLLAWTTSTDALTGTFDNFSAASSPTAGQTLAPATARGVTATGETQTDTLGRAFTRGLLDTGTSESDSLTGAPNRVRGVTDNGLGSGGVTPGTPYLVATPVANATTVSSVTITTNADVAAGDTLFIAVANRVATTGAAVVASVSGVTADEIKTYPHSTLSNGVSLVRAYLSGAGLPSGTAITLTFNTGGVQRAMVAAFAVPGVANANIDVEQGSDEAAGSTFTVTAGGPTTGAPAIEIGVAVKNASGTGSNGTPGTGWTELVDQEVGATTFTVGYVEYRIVSANETPSAVFNWSDSTGAGVALVAAWDGAAASGMSDSVSATKTTGGGTTRNVSDTGVSQSDSISRGVGRALADTGVSETDAVTRQVVRPVSDTGTAQTDSPGRAVARGVSSTGVAQSDSVTKAAVRALTSTGVAQTDVLASARVRAVTSTGVAQTDAVTKAAAKGIADTGTSMTDSPGRLVARPLSDTGVSQSDTVTTPKLTVRTATDAGVSQSDVIAHPVARAVVSTGVSQSDSLTRMTVRGVTSVGESQADSVAAARGTTRAVTDAGVSQSDSPASSRLRAVSDAGVSESDSIGLRAILRAIADAGATVSDAVGRAAVRAVTSTGVVQSDSLIRAIGRQVTDAGASQSDSISAARGPVISISSTGVSQTDALARQIVRPLIDAGASQSDALGHAIVRGVADDGIGYVFTDPFNRTVASGSIGGAWVNTTASALWSVDGNEGVLGPYPTLSALIRSSEQLTGQPDGQRVRARFRWDVVPAGGSRSHGVLLRAESSTGPNNCVRVRATVNTSGGTNLVVSTLIGGVLTSLYNAAASVQPVANGWHWLGAEYAGGRVRAKSWLDGSPEPGAWEADVAETTGVPANPYVGITFQWISTETDASTFQFDDFSWRVFDSLIVSRLPAISDAGASQSDAIGRAGTRAVSDTGVSQSDSPSVGAAGHVGVSDAGVAESDSVHRSIARGVTDAGASMTDAIVRAIRRGVTDTGEAQSDVPAVGGRTIRNVTDAGATQSDSLIRAAARVVTSTGVTMSDAVGRAVTRAVSSTGLSQTDAVGRAAARAVADQGVSESDSVSRLLAAARGVSDQGESQSDQVGRALRRGIIDVGVVEADAVRRAIARPLADTGVAQTDAIGRQLRVTRPLADQGASQADAVSTTSAGNVAVADQGAAQSDSLRRAIIRGVTDAGTAMSDAVRAVHALMVIDAGATISDAVDRLLGAARAVTDTGSAISDALSRAILRGVISAGVSESDALGAGGAHFILLADDGAAFSDSLDVTSLGHVRLTDVGVIESDHLRRLILRAIADRGVAESDATAILSSFHIFLADVGVRLHDFVGAIRRVLTAVGGATGQPYANGRLSEPEVNDGYGPAGPRGKTNQPIVYAHLED